jgi:hypothetical protein
MFLMTALVKEAVVPLPPTSSVRSLLLPSLYTCGGGGVQQGHVVSAAQAAGGICKGIWCWGIC